MRTLLCRTSALVFVCVVGACGPLVAQDDRVRELIQQYTEQLLLSGELTIGDAPIAAVGLIPELYGRREFRPMWAGNANVDDLLNRLQTVHAEGLDPDDYHFDEIQRYRTMVERSNDPDLVASLDILLTEGLIRFVYHMQFGKVDPNELDPNWNLSRELLERDPVAVIEAGVTSESLEAAIEKAFPRLDLYDALKAALATYRQLEASGGWPGVPEGPVLKPGMENDRIAILRRRLARTGDLTDLRTDDPRRYDESVDKAVKHFQDRHGLDADGVAGKQTLDAMNVPVSDRVDQIRVNLERARWVMREIDVTRDFIVTNIAGFEVLLVHDQKEVWKARAQVGKPYRKTPVFKEKLTYVVFNPTWTVPPGILKKDVLPAIQRDQGYLKKKNMAVLDQKGNPVDPASIDWASYKNRGFPYIIRQQPGPNNALGRVKFIFPNDHFVFLHDTPSRQLFDRADRTFSSGCIRVDKPLELAELVLRDPEKWNQETIQAVLDSKKTKTVFLPEPLTVMLLYWTAFVDADGVIHLLRDVYDRDRGILNALEAEFKISLPEGAPDYTR